MFLHNGTMNGHLILGWNLRFSNGWDTCFPTLVKEPAEYPEPDQDDASREALLPEERNQHAPRSAPPPHKVVLFGPLPGQVRHLKWWLTKFFGENVDIFHMYAKMGNDERTEMQLKFQDSRNPSVFRTTPKVGGTGLNLTAANHAVITHILGIEWAAAGICTSCPARAKPSTTPTVTECRSWCLR